MEDIYEIPSRQTKVNVMVANNRLKNKLKECSISVPDLARKIYVSENSVYQYIMGTRKPKFARMVLIADILDTTAEYLFGLSKKEYQKCKTCQMPRYIKRENTTIKNNTGLCSFCYRIKNHYLNQGDNYQHYMKERDCGAR